MKKIEIEDILKYRIPQNLEYNPSGTVLAFEVVTADKEENTYHTSVWVSEEGKVRQLTSALDASKCMWLNDHELILRRKAKENELGYTQLFIIDLYGGEARPWLLLPFELGRMKQIKEDLYVATGTIDKNDPDAYLDTKEKRTEKSEKKKKELHSDYEVLDEIPYWMNGANFTNGNRTAVFLVNGKDGSAKRLTDAIFETGDVKVRDEKIYWTGYEWTRKMPLYSGLYEYDMNSGNTTCIVEPDKASIDGILFLGNRMLVSASDLKEYGVNETRNLYAIKDGELELVYQPKVSLYNSVIGDTAEASGKWVNPDENHFITLATVENRTCIYEFNENMNLNVVWDKDGMVTDNDAMNDQIAFVYQDDKSVAEVFEMKRDGSEVHQLTNLNTEALKDCYVAEPQLLEYQSQGYDLKGWVLLPEDFDESKKYPAILDVHGGPRCAYGKTFFHEMQAWVSKGYVVFFTNIKGSDGLGDAFADIRDDYGNTDFKNLMDFTDEVLKKYPNIDTTRICQTGGSYGGFMTNWIITHTDRFCCAASQRSISNWISMSFMSDIGPDFGPDQCGASSLFDFEKQWNHSPLKYASNCHTPTLFIHSDLDRRCPLPEGMQMMQALAAQNIETKLVLFHGENHELSRSGKPQHRLRRLNEMTKWFDDHTRGE